MKTIRLYQNTPFAEGINTQLDKENSYHLNKVLRFPVGKNITVFNGYGFDYTAVVENAKKTTNIKIISKKGLSKDLIDIHSLRLDDPKVFKLLQDCDTTGVFQLESEGMRGYLKKLKADCFEDIVAMLALYRPGPLDAGLIPKFIKRKNGSERIDFPHPSIAVSNTHLTLPTILLV